MLKENLMKKIAGLSLAAIVMMPSVVSAAQGDNKTPNSTNPTTALVDGTTCTATSMKELTECMSKENYSTKVWGKQDDASSGREDYYGPNYSTVTTIKLSKPTGSSVTEFTINKDATIEDYAIIVDAALTKGIEIVNDGLSNTTLTLKGKAKITASKVVVNKATLNITTKENAITATNLDIKKAVVNISADSTNSNAATTSNNAKAIVAASNADSTITVDASTLNVTKGSIKGNITKIAGASNVNIQDITGAVTIDGDGVTTFKAGTVDGGLTVNGTSVVTVDAKEIKTSATVKNAKATVKYVSDSVTPTVEKGLVRKTNIVSANLSNVEVYAAGLSTVTLLDKNEVLVVKNVNDLGENFKLVGPNGSKIDNRSNTDLTITVNGAAAKVSKDAKGDDAYVVAGAIEVLPPVEPVNPNQPEKPVTDISGDVLPPKNPTTGDNIMSLVSVALTSVASLGLAVKKFLF